LPAGTDPGAVVAHRSARFLAMCWRIAEHRDGASTCQVSLSNTCQVRDLAHLIRQLIARDRRPAAGLLLPRGARGRRSQREARLLKQCERALYCAEQDHGEGRSISSTVFHFSCARPIFGVFLQPKVKKLAPLLYYLIGS
jgi:hypothetical protein